METGGVKDDQVPEESPKAFLIAAAVGMFLALVLPELVGSGRTTVNPFRVVVVIAVHLLIALHALIRIADDADVPPMRRIAFALLLFFMSILVWPTYYILNGVRSDDVLSLRNPFFQIILGIFALAILLSVGKYACRFLQRRRHRV